MSPRLAFCTVVLGFAPGCLRQTEFIPHALGADSLAGIPFRGSLCPYSGLGWVGFLAAALSFPGGDTYIVRLVTGLELNRIFLPLKGRGEVEQ